jgi:hypothetical protein
LEFRLGEIIYKIYKKNENKMTIAIVAPNLEILKRGTEKPLSRAIVAINLRNPWLAGS